MKNKKVLGVFALAMINVAAVLTLRNFPAMAEYGWASVSWGGFSRSAQQPRPA
jgi:glutamate:GABA antiporter